MDLTRANFVRSPWFLITRHPHVQREFYDVIIHWVAENFPKLSPAFHVVDFPQSLGDLGGCVLHHPWLQDPVQNWSPVTYEWANQLARTCDHWKIPIVNRVDRLANAGKSFAARTMSSVGLNVPKMALIRDSAEFHATFLGIPFPLFVREDHGHWGPIIRADNPDQARKIPLNRFKRPLAVQLIDVQTPDDALYRKYRYVCCGPLGVSHHLQATTDWITRGGKRVVNARTRQEEIDYLSRPDPHHELFQRARQALGLDFLAFDYGYDRTDRMIVWETNPFPFIRFGLRDTAYRNFALHRTFAALLTFYLQLARLPIPHELEQMSAY